MKSALRISNELKLLVKTERKITHQILLKIIEAENVRTFAELGFSDMKEWLIKDIGYSATAADRRLKAAQALRAVPEIGKKIESGLLNLTTVHQVQSAINTEEKKTGERFDQSERVMLLTEAEASTSWQVAEKLAARFPEQAKPDSKRIINESQVRVQITITKEQLENLERARELMSHTNAGASLGEVIDVMTKAYLKQRDPLVRVIKPRAKKALSSNGSKNGSEKRLVAAIPAHIRQSPATQSRTATEKTAHTNATLGMIGKFGTRETALSKKRKAIPPSVRNFVFRRDGGCCQFRDPLTGRKCESRYFVELDHIHPWALGGGNEPENLELLCRTHNLLKAEHVFGRRKMDGHRFKQN